MNFTPVPPTHPVIYKSDPVIQMGVFAYQFICAHARASMAQMFCRGDNHVAKTLQQKLNKFLDLGDRVRCFTFSYESGGTAAQEHPVESDSDFARWN